MAWLTGWLYRKKITVTNPVASYQTRVLVGESSGATGEEVDCGGKCQPDFDDIRFTGADGSTLLDYWIESITGTTPNQLATIWVENNATPDAILFLYYGKSDATAVSSGANTFPFFDHFDDASLDLTTKWQVTTANGTYSESGTELTVTAGAGSPATECISSKTATYGAGYALRSKVKSTTDKIQWLAFVTTRGTASAVLFTTCFRKNSGDTNFVNCSGDGVNYELPDTGIVKDAVYRIWEVRRLSGVDDAFFADNVAKGTGQYDTTTARYIDISSYHQSGDIVVDWILVRLYVATEPSFAWGSEQPAYKDIATRFKAIARAYKDVSARFKLVVGTVAYKDIAARFKLTVQAYKDVSARFKTWARNYKDVTIRFRVIVQSYKDIADRFKLAASAYKDISLRFKSAVASYKDIISRFVLIGASTDGQIISEGGLTEGTYVGGSLDYTNLNSDDGDTSYLKSADAAQLKQHTYYFTNFTSPCYSATGVRLYFEVRSTYSYANCRAICRIAGVNYYGDYEGVPNGYGTYSKLWLTNPATGNPWTPSEINAAEFGIELGYSSQGIPPTYYHSRCTYLKRTVYYVPGYFNDIASRLKIIAQAFKDAATRIKLIVQNYKDASVRFVISSTAYRDVATRFRTAVQAFKNAPSRFILVVAKDIYTRFKLVVESYKDIASRFKLNVLAYKNAASRYRLNLGYYIDVANRFKLSGLSYKDISSRFRLIVVSLGDIHNRFILSARNFSDATTRFLLRVVKDVSTRFKIAIRVYVNLTARFKLSVSGYGNTITRFAVGIQIAPVRVMAPVRLSNRYRLLVAQRNLAAYGEIPPYKDISCRFRAT